MNKLFIYESGTGLRIYFILEEFLPGGFAKAMEGSSSSFLKSGINFGYKYLFMRCREPTEGEIFLYKALLFTSKHSHIINQKLNQGALQL